MAACALALCSFGACEFARANSVTLCAATTAELQADLTNASDGGIYAGYNVAIELVVGTYRIGTATSNGPFTYSSTAATGEIEIFGGWAANCDDLTRDASLTVLDGNGTSKVLNIQNENARVDIEFVTIRNGESTTAGGGAAINTNTTGGQVLLYDNIFQNNHTSSIGGGFAADGGGSQVNVVGNLVVNNAADGGYGAGFLYSRNGEEAFVTFNTMYNNTTTAPGGAGGLYCCGTPTVSPFVRANIFRQNTNYGVSFGGTPADLDYNDYGAITGVTPESEEGTVSADPKFVDAAGGNFHLAATSPLLGICPKTICST
ncbi:MAG: hypothetical protein WBV39_10730, partial [Rudaea sp.]